MIPIGSHDLVANDSAANLDSAIDDLLAEIEAYFPDHYAFFSAPSRHIKLRNISNAKVSAKAPPFAFAIERDLKLLQKRHEMRWGTKLKAIFSPVLD